MELFVPGRICLFGEHSDWAGGYRRTNAAVGKGHTIIAGTNQGLYATVSPHPSKLVIKATMPDGSREGPFEIPMDPDRLLAEAEGGGFWSYAAGVAYQLLTHYQVRGLEIDNYRTDLPVRKGLSSSAAVSVLVARAFNRVYDLKMTVRGEMEWAYLGEVTTPSRCGRMDQGCAYGSRPVMMVFDGDRVDVRELTVARDLHFVIVDLCAAKDTRRILNDLNHCFPFADGPVQEGVQRCLGPLNEQITARAATALADGDAEQLGQLMAEAQALFDEYLQPACPSELTAPVLHRVLAHPAVQPLVFGGKGVGSGGDGSAQFVARDAAAQEKLISVIERDLGMPCLALTLTPGPRIRKAVVPAAGFGTRLFPATKGLKKELFPVVGKSGLARPIIVEIVEEALKAGVDEVGVIVQGRDRAIFEDVFYGSPPPENMHKLSAEAREACEAVLEIGRHVTLLEQNVQEGLGHAVYCAREWVGDEPFLLLLGDHLYTSSDGTPCAKQVVDAFSEAGHSVLGVARTPVSEVERFGTVAGTWTEPGSLLAVTDLVEKPSPAYAREHLLVEGLPEDECLTVFGLYALTPGVFRCLEESVSHNMREGGEFQLTSCLDRLRREEGMSGCLVRGRRYDLGTPESYVRALYELSQLAP